MVEVKSYFKEIVSFKLVGLIQLTENDIATGKVKIF